MFEKGKCYLYNNIKETLKDWKEREKGSFHIKVHTLTFSFKNNVKIFILDGYSNQGIYKLVHQGKVVLV